MISQLAVGAAVLVLCVVVGAGFYLGVRHVETMSGIVRNPDRPVWAQQPVDAFNHVVGRPTSREYAERQLDDDEEDS